ncbi:uncharacterized protein LOC108590053 [Callithrix jacchus]
MDILFSRSPARGEVPYWVKSRFAESPRSCSRESRGRLPFAGSGTRTTGSLAGAAGAEVMRRSPESALSGRRCREIAAGAALSAGARPCPQRGLPQSQRRIQPLRLTAAARARESAGSRQPHLRGRPARGPRPVGRAATAGERVRLQAGAPQGHLLAWRLPLENVSGETHVLSSQELNKTILEVPERYKTCLQWAPAPMALCGTGEQVLEFRPYPEDGGVVRRRAARTNGDGRSE